MKETTLIKTCRKYNYFAFACDNCGAEGTLVIVKTAHRFGCPANCGAGYLIVTNPKPSVVRW